MSSIEIIPFTINYKTKCDWHCCNNQPTLYMTASGIETTYHYACEDHKMEVFNHIRQRYPAPYNVIGADLLVYKYNH